MDYSLAIFNLMTMKEMHRMKMIDDEAYKKGLLMINESVMDILRRDPLSNYKIVEMEVK